MAVDPAGSKFSGPTNWLGCRQADLGLWAPHLGMPTGYSFVSCCRYRKTHCSWCRLSSSLCFCLWPDWSSWVIQPDTCSAIFSSVTLWKKRICGPVISKSLFRSTTSTHQTLTAFQTAPFPNFPSVASEKRQSPSLGSRWSFQWRSFG